jgi:aspartate carbamoyltransferase catalytic subunit
MVRNLLAIRHLEQSQIVELLELGKEMKLRVQEHKPLPELNHLVLGMLFFEHSTRTRMSFEQAANYLSMRTALFTHTGSSMSKGETLKDTILTLRFERLDGLVVRHPASGAAQLTSKYFPGPVLNAGDGQHEHPTQALGDALTILERKGRIDGLKVAIVGDVLHSRVARSNAWLLSKMGADVRFVGPKTLMPSHPGMLPGAIFYDLAAGIEGADVVICLRLQKERMQGSLISSVGEYARLYQVNRETVRFADRDCIVLHPGPINRGIELDDAVADGEQSAILSQVENCIFLRMAALYWTFGGHRKNAQSAAPKREVAAKAVAKRPK